MVLLRLSKVHSRTCDPWQETQSTGSVCGVGQAVPVTCCQARPTVPSALLRLACLHLA